MICHSTNPFSHLRPQNHSKNPERGRKADLSGRQNNGQQADGRVSLPTTGMSPGLPRSKKQELPSTQEDPRARFFDDYHKEAEEYDREFMKKYDEDLNTTLIFVSLT